MRSTLRRYLPLIAGPALGLALGCVIAFGGASPGGPQDSGTAGPAAPQTTGFTYPTSWTLLELARHADAGEVVAISTASSVAATPAPATAAADQSSSSAAYGAQAQPTSTGDEPTLVALTTAGQLVPVVSGTTVDEAVGVLRSLGYGRLLTAEALTAERSGGSGPSIILPIIVLAVSLLAVGFLLLRSSRGRSGLDVGDHSFRSGGRRPVSAGAGTMPSVTFDDIAGVDEARLELGETVDFLKDPERFTRVGAKPVRGVLLFGPPGTGKTLLAKAVAHEAGVPFFATSGSEFVEKYVGVGAGRIRELFAAARKAGRGVIFIDEIDAIAKARGGPNSHDEREQTLNQLLVELDGFQSTDSIVVLAATNRLDTLDPAVLRPGRFTRKIHVGMPDREARAAILEVHARGKPLAESVELDALARRTFGFSGAMLADLLNEAAILSVRDGREVIEPGDVHRGWLKTAVGSSRQRSMDERERSIIAAHEAGHAICGRVAGDRRRIEEISLFQHGDALGVTVSSSEDDHLPAESDLRARLVALMGGRVAEELLFREITGGASNDFEKATEIATAMVTRWGMGSDPHERHGGATGRGTLSTIVAAERDVPLSEEVKAAQGRAIRAILDQAYATARATLLREMPRLERVAAYLVENERVDGDEFEALYDGRLAPLERDGWRSPSANPRTPEEIGLALAVFSAASAIDRKPSSLDGTPHREIAPGREHHHEQPSPRPHFEHPENRGRTAKAPAPGRKRRRPSLTDRLFRRPVIAALSRLAGPEPDADA